MRVTFLKTQRGVEHFATRSDLSALLGQTGSFRSLSEQAVTRAKLDPVFRSTLLGRMVQNLNRALAEWEG